MTTILSQDEAAKIGLAPKRKRNKYGAKRAHLDGYGFDSEGERDRYCDLKNLQRADKIEEIEVHPRFDIIMNGKRCGVYEADFRYWDIEANRHRVEDYKGAETALFKLKRALIEAQYGIEIEIVK